MRESEAIEHRFYIHCADVGPVAELHDQTRRDGSFLVHVLPELLQAADTGKMGQFRPP